MPPSGVAKRRRGSGSYSTDEGPRQSPYRPDGSNLAHHGMGSGGGPHHGGYEYRGRGRGRGSGRGGRAGMGAIGAGGAYGGGNFQQNRGSYNHHSGPQNNTPSSQSQQQQAQSSQLTSKPESQRSQQPKTLASEPQEKSATAVVAAAAASQVVEPVPPPVIEVDENFDDTGEPAPPYPWEYATDDCVEKWEEEGREALLAKAGEMIQSEDHFALNAFFLEILHSAVHGRVHPSEAGRFVKDVLADETSKDDTDGEGSIPATEAFLDTVSMLSEAEKKSRQVAVVIYRAEVPPETMRLILDSDLLINLNLVRPTFNKAFIRHQTNVLYRQSNYNLLREETEGYSKLVTELFTTPEDETPSAEVVKETFERVRSMIGTFDLDVGRTLDVTLDVFAAVIVKHHRFFVKFLRDSSWWPQEAIKAPSAPTLPHWALPNVDGMDVLTPDEQASLDLRLEARDNEFWEHVRELGANDKGIQAFFKIRGLDSEFQTQLVTPSSEEDRKWQEITGTNPPVGNKVAAQILGFKLRYYSSASRDSGDELPLGLVHLTALLIKIGFISLRDIYPHLWPEDASMEDVRKRKESEKEESDRAKMPGVGMNALAMAGALTDDTAPSQSKAMREPDKSAAKPDTAMAEDQESKDALPEPRDSKIELLKALLSIGAIPDALYLVGRFPWMLKLVPELPEYLHRLIHHSLTVLYEPIKPLQDMSELRKPGRIIDPDQSGVPKGELRRTFRTEKRVLRWLHLEQYKEEEGVYYRYFWDDWSDNIPVCRTIEDFFTLCDTFVNLSGVKIGQDPLLLAKLIRIGAHSLKEDTSDSNRTRWIDLCKKLLVPALSLTRHNPGVMNEIYDGILRKFPVATRYNIYAEWYLGKTSRLPAISTAFKLCEAETKGLLRRVSRTNVKESARPLAKVSTSSPGITFQVAINQMENYPILVECFVESARFLTDLGYDVLAWSTLNALGRQGRDTTSADGLFTSKWLQSLGDFCGRMIWRYKMFDPEGILYFLDRQLAKGKNNYLKVLDDVIRWMSGIRELTYGDNTILAMSGGPLLQAQTLPAMQDRRHLCRPTAERLRQLLGRTKIMGSLLLGLANECQTRLHKVASSGAPLKLQSNVHDEMFVLMYQYCDFLRSSVPQEQFEQWIPSLVQLMNDFGIEPRLAFFVSRATINIQMDEYEETKAKPSREASVVEDEAEAADEASEKSGDQEVVEEKDVEMTEKTKPSGPPAKSESDAMPWNPVLKNLLEQIRGPVGDDVLLAVGELFYMSFWQLSLEDMVVPSSNYEEEINRQKEKIREINQDRSDLTIYGTRKREEKRSALNKLLENLKEERTQQMAAYNTLARKRIASEKEHWFTHAWGKHDALNTALLEHCFIPRIVLSPLDAVYCFKMLKLLHSTGARNFRTMGFLDQLFNKSRLTVLFFMCTFKEAEYLARFLNEVLKEMAKWHASKTVYENEAYGPHKDLTGFCRRIGSDKSQNQFLEYADFRKLLFKWHGQLANALRFCLESNEYMHMRNAISVLRGVVTVFPAVDLQAKRLHEAVIAINKSDSREDIKLSALSLVNMYVKRERSKEFVPQASFHQINKTGVPVSITQPAQAATAKKLNAHASEFKPGTATGRTEKPEPEDGEINSPVVADAPRQTANGLKQSGATSNLSKTAEAAELAKPADKVARARDEPGSRTGTPKPDPRGESRGSPAPNSNQPYREHGRLPNGRADPTRPPHALPQRPENNAPSARRSERSLPTRGDERGSRDLRPGRDRESAQSEHPRAGRPGDGMNLRTGERASTERGHDRGPDRLPADRERAEPVRRGDIHGGRQAIADDRNDRSERGAWGTGRDERGREPRDRNLSDANREPIPSRDRGGPDSAMAPPVNPDRARLIRGSSVGRDESDSRGRSGRHASSRPGSERGSRAASPVRKDEKDPRPSSRTERHAPLESAPRQLADDRRAGQSRTEREPYIGHDDRSRGPPRSGPPGDGYSRPSRSHGLPPGESQYGRLNAPDPAPTGPRTGNGPAAHGRTSRAPSGMSSHDNPDRSSASDRHASSGPASGRHSRASGSFSRPPPGSSSAPNTPAAADPPNAGHSDRASRYGPGGDANSPADVPRGPSSNNSMGPGRPGLSSASNAPPSPINDRGRGDKRFANLNTTLQQSGGQSSRADQGASIRGRGSRNPPPPSPLGAGPPSGSGPGRHDGPPRDIARPRNDLFADNGPPSGRGRDSDDQRPPPRRSGRSTSPPNTRGPPRQSGPPAEDSRAPPYRRDTARDTRSRGGSHAVQGSADREPRRGGRGDDVAAGNEYGGGSGRHGADRRDGREPNWGGEPRADRSGPPVDPNDAPGSGRKRRGEYEDHGEPKRSRRGR